MSSADSFNAIVEKSRCVAVPLSVCVCVRLVQISTDMLVPHTSHLFLAGEAVHSVNGNRIRWIFLFARFHIDQLSWATITEHLQCAPVWLCPPSCYTDLGSRRPSARKVEDAVNILFDKYFNQKKRNSKEQQQT